MAFENNISAQLPGGFRQETMVLLVADDENFTSNVRAYPLINNGDFIEAENVNVPGSLTYMTIASFDNSMWLKADGNTPANDYVGTEVNIMNDQLVGINNMTGLTVTGTGSRPTVANNGPLGTRAPTLNFNPYLQFSQGHRNYLQKLDFHGFRETGSSVFMVLRRTNTNRNLEVMFSYATGNNSDRDNMLTLVDPENVRSVVRQDFNNGRTAGRAIDNGFSQLVSWVRGGGNNNILGVNGDLTNNNYRNGEFVAAGGSLVLGQDQDDAVGNPANFAPANEWQGDIAEVIVRKNRTSNVESDRIRSYLGVKYGITLDHNYQLSDGSVTWNRGSSGPYNRRIAGIGRDNDFQLDQRKSRSQDPGTDITIQNQGLNSFPIDRSCLIWGANNANHDNITTNNAPTGFEISDRVWKVMNFQDRVGPVTVRIDIPPSKAGNLLGATLLVNQGNANFSANTAAQVSMTSSTATEMIFENVTINDDSYITFGFSLDLSFVNNTPGAPGSFEACPGDNVTFYYEDLAAHPTEVRFVDQGGGFITQIPISFNNQVTNGNGRFDGEMTLTVPNTATTGRVTFMDNTTPIFNTAAFIIIHNPEIDFVPLANPVCANDTTLLVGFPAGGSFSGSSVIGNGTMARPYAIEGGAVGWSASHDISRTTSVTYSYFAEYTNGNQCSSPTVLNKTVTVYDNRLDDITYVDVFKSGLGATPPRLMSLTGRRTIRQTVPNIQPPINFPHPHSFSGTYITPAQELLVDLAPIINIVTFRFNNNGCPGEFTDTLYVYEPISIPGLPDTLCRGADTVHFFRDLSPRVAYNLSQISGNATSGIQRINNEITGTTTIDPAHQVAVSYDVRTPGAEQFTFDPSLLPPGTDSVEFQMEFRSYTFNNSVTPNVISGVGTFIASKTVYITDRPNIDISGTVDSIYCRYDAPDTLRPSPEFENVARTYFTLQGQTLLGQYTLLDTLEQDTILDVGLIYPQLVPLANRNLPLRVIYTVDRFGCVDHDTVVTNLIAPLEPIFFADSAYCTSEEPDLLSVSLRPGSIVGSGTGRFVLTAGLDSAGLFSPRLAGPGDHPVTYILTDLFGCENSYTDTLFVRDPPIIDLFLDGSNTRDQFCGSSTSVPMTFQLLAGSIIDSARYFGAGVLDSTLNPNSVFIDTTTGIGAGTGGTSVVWAVITDTFGCKGVDSMIITILQAPSVNVDTAFNGEASVDVLTNIRAQHTYCRSDAAFEVVAAPFHVDGSGNIRGTFTGEGIITIGDSVSYDPSAAIGTIDSVIYRYEDINGCFNTDLAIIKLDTTPDVALLGLANQYCPNYAIDTLVGVPSPSIGLPGTGFAGPGLNGLTGLFDPSQAGLGQQIYSYTFVDGNFCVGQVFDTIMINSLPTPLFGGLEPQYCTAAAPDTLLSLNDPTPPSYYSFWGAVITDTIGILTPDSNFTGPQLIYYSYTDTNACTNIDSARIFIQPTPVLSVSGLDSSYCFNAPVARVVTSFPARIETGSSTNFSMAATTLSFDPGENTDGLKVFTLIYADPFTSCADTLVGQTFVNDPPSPSYSNLLNFYCETRDTFALSGTPTWGTFTSSSNGIVSTASGGQGFSPARAGTGFHTVIYTAEDTLLYPTASGAIDTLVCLADTQTVVEVRPLPDPKILQPTNNQSFCSNDTLQELIPAPSTDTTWHIFRDTGSAVTYIINTINDTIRVPGGIQITQVQDTVYYFDPTSASNGSNVVTYVATNIYGCVDSTQHTFVVYQYTPRSFQIDSAYCESADSVILLGSPAGGSFTRNGVPLTGLNGTSPYFVPNPGYWSGNFLTSTVYDTIEYSLVDGNGACQGDTAVVVRVDPVPQISYTSPFPHNTYCEGMGAIPLTPNIPGGSFSGNGIINDSTSFLPDLAQPGIHPVVYSYRDSATGCTNEYVDTLYVYGMPQVSFNVVGGCQLDSVRFIPDNDILGLDNIFQNQVIDSITGIQWVFEPTVSVVGTSDSNRIDSIGHAYSAPGVYFTQLIVANRVHCIDTHTVRLVVSPKISSYPYDEGFENGDGNWFAESRDANRSLLWEHGVDNTPGGFGNDPSNSIWATALNQSYQASEDAWVYSPCFDLDSLSRPMISLDYWTDTRDRADGAIIEYQLPDGSWKPLGEVNRGISWFNSDFIAGQPGDFHLPPIGWSGATGGWVNGRYKLDDYRGPDNVLRLRVAFGSSAVPPGSFYDGFAFDNVWIGNRTRNVLLETTSNILQPNMHLINNYVYNLVYHTPINKDVIMIQYHTGTPDQSDQFFQNARPLNEVRLLDYGSGEPGRAYINGAFNQRSYSSDLVDTDFEQDMLRTPKFSISIDSFKHMSTTFLVEATVVALEDMPRSDYRIYTSITQDSLFYQSTINYPSMMQAVIRQDDDGQNVFTRSWVAGDTQRVSFAWNHATSPFINYQENHFQAVVFVQDKNTEQVFQAETSRDISGYWIGVDQVQAQEEYNEISSMVLFPNPAREYFNLRFDAPLRQEYQWRLVDIRGIEVQQGTAPQGTEQLTFETNHYPAGTYVLLLYNNNVFAQRKVIIRR